MEKEQIILDKLIHLEKIIMDSSKEILNRKDVSNYTGYSEKYIQKLCQKNIIPHYRPNRKFVFFERSEIEDWLRQNKSKSISQIDQEAQEYINKSRKK